MSKLIIEKDYERLTLLDEQNIQKLIDERQNIRIGYLSGSSFIEEGHTNLDNLSDWTPLKETDVVIVYALSAINTNSIRAKDGTTVLASLNESTELDVYNWGILIYIDVLQSWVLRQITETTFYSTAITQVGALSNLGTNAGAAQSTINQRIDGKFGDLESNTITITVTYTDNSTETVVLYKQAPQQQS